MRAARFLTAVVALFLPGLAWAQAGQAEANYPSRTINYVVPFQAGSSLDAVARLIAQKLSESLGQPVVVENRTGAGGNLGVGVVARAAPDGYTLLHTINSLAAAPALYPDLGFDPVRDLAPIVEVAAQPFMLVVNASSPLKSVKDLIDYAASNPGKLNFGSSGTGSLDHLAGELFSSQAGIRVLHVPYRGGPAVLADIMAGQIDFTFTGMAGGLPLVQSGKLRALAVTSARRAAALPDVPSLSEAGLTGYDVVNSSAIYAPANTPAPIIARLNGEVLRILAMPDIRDRFTRLGVEAIGGTPERLAAVLQADVAKWKDVVEKVGIRLGN